MNVTTVLSDREARTSKGTARVPAVRASIMSQFKAKKIVELMCMDLSLHKILCVGCTGGKHRGPTLAMEAADQMRKEGWDIEQIHLGLMWFERRWASQQVEQEYVHRLASRILAVVCPDLSLSLIHI